MMRSPPRFAREQAHFVGGEERVAGEFPIGLEPPRRTDQPAFLSADSRGSSSPESQCRMLRAIWLDLSAFLAYYRSDGQGRRPTTRR